MPREFATDPNPKPTSDTSSSSSELVDCIKALTTEVRHLVEETRNTNKEFSHLELRLIEMKDAILCVAATSMSHSGMIPAASTLETRKEHLEEGLGVYFGS